MARDEITWLSTREAADQLGVTTRTLDRLIDNGQVRAYKFGRVIRLKEHEVESFVEGARIAPGELTYLHGDRNTDDES